jgi:GT2 family glycosyltransferase
MPEKQLKKVVCVCINYFVEEEVAQLASDFLGQKSDKQSLFCIVVDNSNSIKDKDAVSLMAASDKRLSILVPDKNIGYLGGACYALDRFSVDHGFPDFFLISNPDIRITDPKFVDTLCQQNTFSGSPVAMIAPTIHSTLSNVNQNPYMTNRPSCRKMSFQKLVFSLYPIATAYQLLAYLKVIFKRRKYYKDNDELLPDREKTIYAGHGSFIILTRNYFTHGGNLRYGAFLFGEELFLAETIRSLGMNVLYVPHLKVQHDEHKVTGLFKSYELFKFQRNAIHYCHKLLCKS